MPKKVAGKLQKQLNVRVSQEMYDRVEQVAQALSIDPSDLVRLILAEKLPEYEERATQANRRPGTIACSKPANEA